MTVHRIHTLDLAGLEALLTRARAEGWNPGVDDAAAFLATDPDGFLALSVDQRFAAGISVVRVNAEHGFLGLYIAAPALRGRGHGYALWQGALERLDARGVTTVGLDGVVAQQDNYRRSGFEYLHRNVRYGGAVLPPGTLGPGAAPGTAVRPVDGHDLDALVALDARVGGVERRAFLLSWCLPAAGTARHTVLAERDGRVVGFGTIRHCRGPWKIGPLLAEDAATAESLLATLLGVTGDGDEFTIDVPEPNAAAVALAERSGLSPVFETARMYRGPAPTIDVGRLFGIGTLELG